MTTYAAKTGTPHMESEQASAEVTFNEFLNRFDSLHNLSVVDRDLAKPPGGPSNGDTYILLQEEHTITAVNTGTEEFQIAGDQTSKLSVGERFRVTGSTGNDGTYTISTVAFTAQTDIVVDEDITDATVDGQIEFFEDNWNYPTVEGAALIPDNGSIGIYHGGWIIVNSPVEGWDAYLQDEDILVRWSGTYWSPFGHLYADLTDSNEIANTITETDFDNTYTVKANDLNIIGKRLRVKVGGKFSTTLGGSTFKFRLYAGSVELIATATNNYTASGSNNHWSIEWDCYVSAVGATGTILTASLGRVIMKSTVFGSTIRSSAVVDLTGSNELKVSLEMGIASASNKATMEFFEIDVLN